MSAQGMWDASKHHHGFHGQWASTGVASRTADAEHIQAHRPLGRRSPSAFQPRTKASGRRTDKRNLQQNLEVARGVRDPRNQKERDADGGHEEDVRRQDALRAGHRSTARRTDDSARQVQPHQIEGVSA